MDNVLSQAASDAGTDADGINTIGTDTDNDTGSASTTGNDTGKHKIKVYDKEVELTYDELKRRAEEASGAQEKFRQASEMMKQAKAFMEENYKKIQAADQLSELIYNLRNNPESISEFMEALGIDADSYYQQRIIERMRRQAMPENERRLLEIQEENERLRRRFEEIEREKQEQYQAREEVRAFDSLAQELQDYVSGKGLTKAEIRGILMEMRYDPSLSVEQAHRKALGYFDNYHKAKITKLNPDELPDTVKDSIRKANIAKAKQARRPLEQPSMPTEKSQKSFDDFFKHMDKVTGGR